MKSGHSHIIQAYHLIAVSFSGQSRFLRHRNVRGSCGCHYDLSQSVRFRKLTDGADPCILSVIQLGIGFPDFFCLFRRKTGDQDRLYLMLQHSTDDAHHLLRCFSCTIDHLSCTLADSPMQIHLRVTDVLKRFFLDGKQCIIHGKLPVFHGFQCFSDLAVHPRTSKSKSTAG